ncbi:MAG: hypothetical protein HDR02_09565 [Lachnospiraceae bacterium]|nr:hypothetical protein [Lachnospiraceae bacterium]
MIKKLAIRKWVSAGPIILFCAGCGCALLSWYGAAALRGLRGLPPRLSESQSMDNIYIGAVLGLFALVLAVIMLVRQLSLGVGRQVKRYLANNPEVTMEQIESDYAAAEQYGDIWIGSRWTIGYDLIGVIIENEKIAWVYNEVDRGRKSTQYYLCLGTVDGKIVKSSVEREHLEQMKARYAQFPHILIDNSSEYEHMFKNNLAAFLDIQYNQNVK